MAFTVSPSLCTAAAKGDTATVEKHLQAQCCNPLASQYFVNPTEDPNSPAAIVGIVKKKRNVTTIPKNDPDQSAIVKPATPLQVALYYKEEGVLFLLLNHFLKICHGNVSRCYDETAEAIATVNGYSHLMDFFQYYDSISRDSFGSCWTEAMRHICDLTTKLNKYRKHNADLLQERDMALKAREQAVLERDSLARERVVATKGVLEHKEGVIQRLQQSLQEKELAFDALKQQANSLRDALHHITGGSALEAQLATMWDFRVLDGGDVQIIRSTTPAFAAGAEDSADCSDPPISVLGSLDGNEAPVSTTSLVSDCMRHQMCVATQLEYLQDYVDLCRRKHDGLLGSTVALVEAVQARCCWNSQVGTQVELHAECGLELGFNDLHALDYGTDLEAMDGILQQLIANRASTAPLGDVAKAQEDKARQIRDLMRTHKITNDSSVQSLEVLMGHLQKVVSSQRIHHLLAEVEDRITTMETQVLHCAQEKERSEASGSVLAVEQGMQRQMEAQRRLLDHVKAKLDLLEAMSLELSALATTEERFEATLGEVQAAIARRQELAAGCRKDAEAVRGALAARPPRLQRLQDADAAAGVAFSEAIATNDAAQRSQWKAFVAALGELVLLQEARMKLVQQRVEQILSLKRHEREHETFVRAAEQHLQLLMEVGQKCQVSEDVGHLIISMVKFGQEKVHDWLSKSTSDMEDATLASHQLMYDRFRDWFLTQGEYTHKKKMLLKDVRRKIMETDNRKQLAIQRLDASAEQHGEILKQLEGQRLELETAHIPRLEGAAAAARPLLAVTQAYLTQRGRPFTHPEVDLRQRNEKREMEIHMREVSKYQELLLASQQSLFECSSLPDPERLLLLENHQRIDARACLGVSKDPREGHDPAVEENRLLKQQLQEQFVMIPLDFLDPISLEIMADPVVASDGHTYERTSITRWVQKKGTSPKSGATMDPSNLKPNPTLKDAIEAWKAKQSTFLEQQHPVGTGDTEGCMPVGRLAGPNEGAEPPALLTL